jgi:Transposase DDE domain
MTKGAMKVHTLLDHAGHVPAVVVLHKGKRSEIAVACGLHLPVDSIMTMDRGYIDDQFLFRLHQQGVYFVTRPKLNAQMTVTARVAVGRSTGVTAEYDVVLTSPKGRAYPARLWQVRYRDAATGKHYACWTNALHLAATTITVIYQ